MKERKKERKKEKSVSIVVGGRRAER